MIKIDQDWRKFQSLVDNDVKTFHQAISRHYHSHTYAFYGDDAKHKTWEDVVWARSLGPHLHNARPKPVVAPLNLALVDDNRVGTQLLTETPSLLAPSMEAFTLRAAAENGDGTVPIRSGRAPAPYVKACIAFPDVDHEGAYNPVYCRQFALWAITRIVGNVKGTPMEYTQ